MQAKARRLLSARICAELRQQLDTSYGIARPWAAIGFSMAAYGALKIALRNPERCVAVTALCPVVFPAESADAVPAVNRPSVLNDLNQPIGTNPETSSSNSVYDILRRNRTALRFARPEIYLDCGKVYGFNLHDGQRIFINCWTAFGPPHLSSVPFPAPVMPMPGPTSGRKRPFVSSVMR